MKTLATLLAAVSLGLCCVQPVTAQENTVNVPNSRALWTCVVGDPAAAMTSIRISTITSVSKHTYNVSGQTVREVTIDTTGNNSIRFYCMNVNQQVKRYKDRLSNTKELLESKTGVSTSVPTKKFPEGTYSHNVEYQVEDVTTLDKIFDSVIKAIDQNKGTTLKLS